MGRFINIVVALTAMAGIQPVIAVPAATSTCTTITMTANYDDLPTGAIGTYKGLKYEGFEVVKAADTPFKARTKPNLLKLKGTEGVIRAAKPYKTFNDLDTSNMSGAHTFAFGCANATSAAVCEWTKIYGVPCASYGCQFPNPHYDIYFDAPNYQHKLELGIGAEGQNPPNITFSLYQPAEGVHLYMDQYIYYVMTC